MKYNKILFVFLISILASCTKLDESFKSELEQGNTSSITAGDLLVSAYNSISGPFQGNADLWASATITSDEAIAPTRAGDWDDNGAWRALHLHNWNADHGGLNGAFTSLLGAQFAASNVLQFNPTPQQAAEARFLRALSMFWVLDGFDQVPYREKLNDYKALPAILKGTAAADYIVKELNAIMNDLPDSGPAYLANKNAARSLLIKLYLNKGVYANRKAPAFDASDMNQVITIADQIIASNKYALSNAYFDNFEPENDIKSTEIVYSFYNSGTSAKGSGNMRGFTFMVSHYNQNPGGWNGFATLSDFYDKFQAGDKRLGSNYAYTGSLPNPGNRQNVGFLIGQQYDLTTDAPLKARNGDPLIFTRDVKLIETNAATLEQTGIRVLKYPFDYATSGDFKKNDFVVFRYADVLLMKAEALLRTGKALEALVIVNLVRAKRGASPFVSVNLDQLLDERGRELYWEGYRRQDLIRFGKWLQAWHEKPADTDPKTLLFPIPSNQLAVNPALTQNPGY